MDLEQYNKDSSVQGIIDYVVSYPRFVHEYRKLTYNMPSDKILQRVAGEELPANLQGKSIRELAQRLRDRLQDESKKWCKSYRCINKFLTTGVQRANDLVVMQQITQGWSGRSAVDESKMKKALKLDDLEEAVKVLAEPRQDLIKEARTLLHNIHLSNPDFHTVYSEMESLVTLIDSWQNRRRRKMSGPGKRPRHQGIVRRTLCDCSNCRKQRAACKSTWSIVNAS